MAEVKIQKVEITFSTRGNPDVIDLTARIQRALDEVGIKNGVVICFHPGSTAGLTTIEYEPGLKKDLPALLEKLIPQRANYQHNLTWGDGNAFSHLRHALIGPSLSIPIESGRLLLGTWQQVVLLDFDTTSRRRKVILEFIGC